MNLCKDCRFYSAPECNCAKNFYQDPLTGRKDLTLTAYEQRAMGFNLGEQCGINGDWFKSNEPDVLNCPEGHRAFVRKREDNSFQVVCERADCWRGPSKTTANFTIQFWNNMVRRLQQIHEPS